jgi:hypothetical protein
MAASTVNALHGIIFEVKLRMVLGTTLRIRYTTNSFKNPKILME